MTARDIDEEIHKILRALYGSSGGCVRLVNLLGQRDDYHERLAPCSRPPFERELAPLRVHISQRGVLDFETWTTLAEAWRVVRHTIQDLEAAMERLLTRLHDLESEEAYAHTRYAQQQAKERPAVMKALPVPRSAGQLGLFAGDRP